ncbi:hypothetical protein ROZALSC1DRAFT_25708, partial [Rozella allomycis CSF55]
KKANLGITPVMERGVKRISSDSEEKSVKRAKIDISKSFLFEFLINFENKYGKPEREKLETTLKNKNLDEKAEYLKTEFTEEWDKVVRIREIKVIVESVVGRPDGCKKIVDRIPTTSTDQWNIDSLRKDLNDMIKDEEKVDNILKKLVTNEKGVVEVSLELGSFEEKKFLDLQNNEFREFFLNTKVYYRKCYKSIMEKIEEREGRSFIVSGSPGVGKSSALLAVLKYFEGKSSVYVEFENGCWIYYNFNTSRTVKGKGEVLYDLSDCWVLLDGHARDKYIGRKTKTIVFCSPQKKNYQRFQKSVDACFVYIPPWTIEEINEFIDNNDFNVSEYLPVILAERKNKPSTEEEGEPSAILEKYRNAKIEIQNDRKLTTEQKERKLLELDTGMIQKMDKKLIKSLSKNEQKHFL